MRVVRYLIFAMALCIGSMPHASALEAVEPVPLLPQSPLTLSAYSVLQDGTPRYVEIYNSDDVPQNIQGWSLSLTWGARAAGATITNPLLIPLGVGQHGYIPPRGSIVLGFDGSVLNSLIPAPAPAIQANNYLKTLSLTHANFRPYERSFTSSTTQAPVRLGIGANGYTSSYIAEYQSSLSQTPLYIPATETGLRIVELYPNPRACQPFDTDVLCSKYVKFYNPTDSPIDLSKLRIRTGSFGQAATASNTSTLTGLLAPYSYGVVLFSLTSGGNWVWLEDYYGVNPYPDTSVEYPSSSSQKGRAWAYDSATGQWRWTAYPTPYDSPNQFTDGRAVNSCSAFRLSEIGANLSNQFIELYNASGEAASLGGCQIQTNRSQDISHVFGDQMLQAGEFAVVQVAATKLVLTKTTSGTVYLLSSDGQTEVDARSYENLSENTSYALVDGVWQQTFAVTPGGANTYEQYPACEAGYVRNYDTGRCNKLPAVESAATCRIDQYRSPETGRCRNIDAATASSLSPCKEGQYRSPETNRCRSASTASAELKPCAAGQERNPDTNRCRKAASGDGDAGFEVVPAQNASDQLVSWLALAGMGVASLGYAGWEWRREMWDTATKILGLFPSAK